MKKSMFNTWKWSWRVLIVLGLMVNNAHSQDKALVKAWNFQVWMSNNNNLHRFGVQNFHQMTQVGSGPAMNILLQMDEYGKPESMRFYIERDNAKLVQSLTGSGNNFSGTPENLFD